MIEHAEALERARRYLSSTPGLVPVEILTEATMELDFGWMFFYQSTECLRTHIDVSRF